jgi:hypothetical protein
VTPPDEVVVVDLRGFSGTTALRRVDEVLATAPPTAVRGLVIIDAAALETGQDVFERAFSNGRIASVVCLAVGAPVHRGDGSALRVTAVLNSDGAVTLWVGAASAVPWRMGSARLTPPDPADTLEPATLDGLVQCLTSHEIFDRVVEAGARMPARVASPGLLVRSSRVDGDEIAAAESAAVAILIGRSDVGPNNELDPPDLAPLLAGATPVVSTLGGGFEMPVKTGSPLDTSRRATWRSLRQMEAALYRLTTAGYLAGPSTAWSQVSAAGQALSAYRDAIAGALEEARRDALERLGAATRRHGGLDREVVGVRLREVVEGGVGQYPMTSLVRWLRGVADRAAPQGSAAWIARLERPPERLIAPPPFPLRPAPPPVLFAAAVCGFLAGLPAPSGWPVLGTVTGAALALLWTVLVWRCLALRPAPPGQGGALAAVRPALLFHLAAAGSGAAAGAVVGAGLPVPSWASVPAAAAGAAGLAVCLSLWWLRAARRWAAELDVPGARRILAGWEGVFAASATLEWQLAGVRRFTADAARALATTLRQASELLQGYAAGSVTGAPATARLDANAAGGDDLPGIVANDLADAVRAALEPGWSRLHDGTLGQLRADTAGRLAVLLTEYRRHRERHHVFEPPPFARTARNGDRPLLRLLGPPARLARLLSSAPSEPFGQLCGAADLSLLDASPHSAQLVRFAPRFALGGVDSVSDVCWTARGQVAGVLRLVPLRPGTVEVVWAHNSTNTDEM